MQFIRRFHDSKQPTDDEIQIHSPSDHSIRNIAAFKALGINSGYIGWKSIRQVQPTVAEFLQHHDARVRRAMFGALPGKKEVINAKSLILLPRQLRISTSLVGSRCCSSNH